MVSRTVEATITAKGRVLIRMDGDVAHRLYRPESVFTVCGVRACGLEQLREGPFTHRATVRMCGRCWAGAALTVLAPAQNEVKIDE